MKINWQGVYLAVTTQNNNDMSVNVKATQAMVDSLVKKGVDDVIALGTIGKEI